MAEQTTTYDVRTIRKEDIESTAAACFAAFDGFSKMVAAICPHDDFRDMDMALKVVGYKVQRLSGGVDGVVAVAPDGKVLGGCFAEVMGEVVAVGPVFVRPEAGGKGIGRAINAALLNKVKERQLSSVRLVQNTLNRTSFRLYHSLGYHVVDMWSYFSGFADDVAITSGADLSVRRLRAEDVPACGALYTEATGLHRDENIRESSAQWPAWVVTDGDRVVGYRTAPIVTGHGVFETEEAFVALHVAASRELRKSGGPPLEIHISCRLYPKLIDWALRSGLTFVRQNAHMVIGEYKDPKVLPIYSPSIEC